MRICNYLAANYDRFVLEGQIRHFNKPDYWQKLYYGSVGDIYGFGVFQNGAYWATPTGWVGYAIAQVDREKTAKLFREYIATCKTQGIQEFIFEDGQPGLIEVYASSVTNLFHALRRLERESALLKSES